MQAPGTDIFRPGVVYLKGNFPIYQKDNVSEKQQLTIEQESIGLRLDVFLNRHFPQYSRSYFNRLIKNGLVLVNNKPSKSGYLLRLNDRISLEFVSTEIQMEPVSMPIDIVFEDEDLIVVNKPAGMVVHPGKGNETNTLVNALLHYTSELADTGSYFRPGIVHRLDKDTSGLLVVAKNDRALWRLRKQFDTKQIHRVYWALLWGDLTEDKGLVNEAIARSRKNPIKFVVDIRGKEAITHYTVLKRFQYISLVEFKLQTGRTHQIRVHANFLKHPVVGDQLYNGRENQLLRLPQNLRKRGSHLLKLLKRQALHAKKLSFIHPSSGQRLHFEVPLPADMQEALDKLADLFLLETPSLEKKTNELPKTE